MKSQTSKKKECIPIGCVPSAVVAVSGRGGCLTREVSAQGGGVYAYWGVCPGGGGVCRGGCLSRRVCPGVYTSPPCEQKSQTGVKNITFPQLRLRTVINCFLLQISFAVIKAYAKAGGLAALLSLILCQLLYTAAQVSLLFTVLFIFRSVI